jgi:hypothetical protein
MNIGKRKGKNEKTQMVLHPRIDSLNGVQSGGAQSQSQT